MTKILSLGQDGTMQTKGELMEYTVELRGGRNLFIIHEAEEDKLLAWATGLPAREIGSVASGFISVKSGEQIMSSHPTSQLIYFDKDKIKLDFAQMIGGKSFRVLDDIRIAYMRVSFRNNFLAGRTKDELRVKIEKGNIPTGWTPAPEDLGLSFPNWVQNFTPSIHENGVLCEEFIEGEPISFGNQIKAKEFREGAI